MKRTIFSLLLLLIAFTASSSIFEVDGLWYEITTDNTVTLIAQRSDDGAQLSFKIYYEGDVTIPETVNYEGQQYTVTAVEEGTFRNSAKLTSVTIPATVTSLGEMPFVSCVRLSTINLSEENPSYSLFDGVLYDKDFTTLIACPGARQEEVSVHSSATTISPSAFQGCTSLTSVTLSAGIQQIGADAFNGCKKITSVNIPYGVTAISDGLFANCTSLQRVNIPKTVTVVGDKAFYQCSKLTAINLPNSVKKIGNSAFSLCSVLAAVSLLDGLCEIGTRAFENCTKLTAVDIPASVTTIAPQAFYGCTALQTIAVDGENEVYASVDGALLDKAQTTLICCPAGKIGDYVVPSTVTAIEDDAFYLCKYLDSIILPANLESVGNQSFRLCNRLTTIALPPSVQVMGENVFSSCQALESILIYAPLPPVITSSTFTADNKDLPLYVTEASLDTYKDDEYWKEFNTILPITDEVVSGMKGDTNDDGVVNITDLMQTVNHVIGIEIPGFRWQMGDVNHDAFITIADVMTIVNIIIGQE